VAVMHQACRIEHASGSVRAARKRPACLVAYLTTTRNTVSTRARIAALAGAAVLALTGTTALLASQSGGSGTAAGPRPPRCTVKDVSAGLYGYQADLANRGFILTLTNTSNGSCSVDGCAGLKLENASHHLVHSSTHRGGTYFVATDPRPRLIVLSPGETASADLAYGSGTGGPTDSVATYLLVAPPGTARYRTVLLPGAPLRINLGNLYETALERHTPYNT
jgi:hypothetical protein